MPIIYTTAPVDYDGFGSQILERTRYRDSLGQRVRRVLTEDAHHDWQCARYGSGMHMAATPEQWEKLKHLYMVETERNA